MLPLLQLIILGNAFGGNIKNVILGVVNLDRGPQSVDVLERVRAVGANARTFLPTDYDDQGAAIADLRKGVLGGVLIIPQHYSRDLLEQHQPHLALITDNTDRSVAGAVGDQMSDSGGLHQRAAGPAPRTAAGRAGRGRSLSLHRLHEVFAARFGVAGHLHDRHDRRRPAVHRRQGARPARRLHGDAHHQVGADSRLQPVRRDQGDAGGRDRPGAGRRGGAGSPTSSSRCACWS